MRLYETQGRKTEAAVTFLGKHQDFLETNLLEEELKPQTKRVLEVNPYAIKTLKLRAGVRASPETS